MQEIVFYVSIFLIVIQSHMFVLIRRQFNEFYLSNATSLDLMLKAAYNIAALSIIVWGFLELKWWVIFVAFAIIAVAAQLILGKKLRSLLYIVFPITLVRVCNIVTVMIALYLWFF